MIKMKSNTNSFNLLKNVERMKITRHTISNIEEWKVNYSYLYAMDYLLCVMKSFRRRSSHLKLIARDLFYIHSYESQFLTFLF